MEFFDVLVILENIVAPRYIGVMTRPAPFGSPSLPFFVLEEEVVNFGGMGGLHTYFVPFVDKERHVREFQSWTRVEGGNVSILVASLDMQNEMKKESNRQCLFRPFFLKYLITY